MNFAMSGPGEEVIVLQAKRREDMQSNDEASKLQTRGGGQHTKVRRRLEMCPETSSHALQTTPMPTCGGDAANNKARHSVNMQRHCRQCTRKTPCQHTAALPPVQTQDSMQTYGGTAAT